MIAFLKGKFVSKSPATVIVEVNSMGYEVHISLNTYSHINGLEEGLLHTYLHVKEDAMQLYGFADLQERSLFMHLISVSGVGTGTARVMLSGMKPEELRQAIVGANEHALERVKGIGNKTAKRIILELKDKLGKIGPMGDEMGSITASMGNNIEQDALHALLSLGIARNAAVQAIQKSLKQQPQSNVEELIKLALKNI
ncbi:MAG: Holliday junction branch migration protein RuvA [Chitinophagaceae bacterium]|nr:Holliday junction branch migration protein RuvA [Chitinophagaceae bacterium]